MSNKTIVAGQFEKIAEIYPRGAKAIELLTTGRNLAERYMQKPGVTPQELHSYIEAVDFILGPMERTEVTR